MCRVATGSREAAACGEGRDRIRPVATVGREGRPAPTEAEWIRRVATVGRDGRPARRGGERIRRVATVGREGAACASWSGADPPRGDRGPRGGGLRGKLRPGGWPAVDQDDRHDSDKRNDGAFAAAPRGRGTPRRRAPLRFALGRPPPLPLARAPVVTAGEPPLHGRRLARPSARSLRPAYSARFVGARRRPPGGAHFPREPPPRGGNDRGERAARNWRQIRRPLLAPSQETQLDMSLRGRASARGNLRIRRSPRALRALAMTLLLSPQGCQRVGPS
jgi:hypothetical protein